MHILVLASWYPSSSNPAAGLFIYDQMLALSQSQDIRISLIDWGPNEYSLRLFSPLKSICILHKYFQTVPYILTINSRFTQINVPHVTWTSHIFRGNNGRMVLKVIKRIPSIVSSFGKIDLIHAHVAFPAGYIAMKVSKALKIPYLITEHSGPFPFNEFRTPFGIKSIVLQPLRRASKIIAVSSWLAESIGKYVGEQPIIISNSVDTEFFKPATINKPASTVPVLFCLSWLTEAKGIQDLLLAVNELLIKKCKFIIRIGGSGKEAGKFHQMAEQLGISESVKWLGILNRQQALEEFQNCDFYVMPSRLESLSMVILEATACGKPVVATECGGPVDLLTTAQGLLIKPGDFNLLSRAMETMLFNYSNYDESVIRRLCVSRFSHQVTTEKILQIYTEILLQQSSLSQEPL